MNRTWLTALVRARQVQEDTARNRLAAARRQNGAARADLARREAEMDGLSARVDEEMTTPAFVAAAAALHSAAAVRSQAVFAVGQAELTVDARADELRVAATARGAAEKLHERVDTLARARAAHDEQAHLDEQAARVHRARQVELR